MMSFLKRVDVANYLGKYRAGAEGVYGVIIVMTFTSTLRNVKLDTQNIYSTIVLSALYCCIAWGLADGFFYAWERSYNEKNRRILIEESRSEDKKQDALGLVKEDLDDTILGSINDDDRQKLYKGILGYLSRNQLKEPENHAVLKTLPNYLVGTTLLSVGAGVLVLAPFFFFRNDIVQALNLSNLLGIATLFLIGYRRTEDKRPLSRLSSGIVSALLGVIIALITIAIGG